MKILLVTPAGQASRAGVVTGNDITSRRWAHILDELGHDVAEQKEVQQEAPPDASVDVLLALHATKSAPSILAFREQHPHKPLLVALTGTDIYEDLSAGNEQTRRSLEAATRLVVLQPGALEALERWDPRIRAKATVIYQSAPALPPIPKADGCFQVCVLANLREVKNPFLVADAAELLPTSSRVRVVHAGEALSVDMFQKATALTQEESRYRWIGALSHAEARLLLARSHLCLLTSRSEGGSNVLSEALACAVPILATEVPGVTGLLGRDYPGYVASGDAQALAHALDIAETDPHYYQKLEQAGAELAHLVDPSFEQEAWKQLLATLEG